MASRLHRQQSGTFVKSIIILNAHTHTQHILRISLQSTNWTITLLVVCAHALFHLRCETARATMAHMLGACVCTNWTHDHDAAWINGPDHTTQSARARVNLVDTIK